MNLLLTPPTISDLLRLLRAWRLWLLGATLGGLLGLAVYSIFPPHYRAQATVLVNFNVEQSWPNLPDREVFYYLDRQSRQLEEIAWSDAVLAQVAESSGTAETLLRREVLTLSQPADGGWHFYADSAEASLAAQTASAWAESFTTQAQSATPQFDAWLEVTPTQIKNLPVTRSVPIGSYALAGAGFSLALLALWALFVPRPAQP